MVSGHEHSKGFFYFTKTNSSCILNTNCPQAHGGPFRATRFPSYSGQDPKMIFTIEVCHS